MGGDRFLKLKFAGKGIEYFAHFEFEFFELGFVFGIGGEVELFSGIFADVVELVGIVIAGVVIGSGRGGLGVTAAAVGQQVAEGSTGVFGVMLESFLVGGRQDNGSNPDLTYGQSITDACMSWEVTVPVIEGLADSVRARRKAGA